MKSNCEEKLRAFMEALNIQDVDTAILLPIESIIILGETMSKRTKDMREFIDKHASDEELIELFGKPYEL